MPVCVGARAAGGRAQSALGQVPYAGRGGGGGIGSHHGSVPGPAAPRTVGPGGSWGGGGDSRQGHTFVVLQRAVVGACGGLCVPGAVL